MNKIMKRTNGRRSKDGSMTFAGYNMQARELWNIVAAIRGFLEDYKPDLLAISEAELREDVDTMSVQIEGYTLHTSKALHNQNLKVARMVVYVKSDLCCDCMDELENSEDVMVWLLFRKHGMRPMRLGWFYREQSQRMGITLDLTNRNTVQLERWD